MTLFSLFCQGCLPYLLHLGYGQYEIITHREKIEEILEKSRLKPDQIAKLQLVQKARKFGIENLSLNPEGGYIYYTALDRDEVGWHVTASYPLKMESYQWWFPIVGNVPYKGYFNKEKAQAEEQNLKEKGLDTKLRITAGYSTLGWFSDPLLSPQLKLRKDELVALVIHEMTHATVYFPNDSLFNESYASFVEEEGTKAYYSKSDDVDREKILSIRKETIEENKKIFKQVQATAFELKEIYNSEIGDADKLKAKEKKIEEFREKVLELSRDFKYFHKERFKLSRINNENFIGALRYQSGTEFFEKKFIEVNKDFSLFHKEIKKLESLSKEERASLLKEESK